MECVQWRSPHSPSLGTSVHSRPRNPFAETALRHPTWLAPVLVYEPLLHSLFTCSHREGREAPAGVTQVPSRAPDGTSAGDGWRLLSRPRQALSVRARLVPVSSGRCDRPRRLTSTSRGSGGRESRSRCRPTRCLARAHLLLSEGVSSLRPRVVGGVAELRGPLCK